MIEYPLAAKIIMGLVSGVVGIFCVWLFIELVKESLMMRRAERWHREPHGGCYTSFTITADIDPPEANNPPKEVD